MLTTVNLDLLKRARKALPGTLFTIYTYGGLVNVINNQSKLKTLITSLQILENISKPRIAHTIDITSEGNSSFSGEDGSARDGEGET